MSHTPATAVQHLIVVLLLACYATTLLLAHNGPHPIQQSAQHHHHHHGADFDATVGYQRGGLGDGKVKAYSLGDNAGDNGSYQVYEGVNIYTIEALFNAGHVVDLQTVTCAQAVVYERDLIERSIDIGNRSMKHYLTNRDEQYSELLAIVLEIGSSAESRKWNETLPQLAQALHSKWDHVIDLSALVRNQIIALQRRGGALLAAATGRAELAALVPEKYTWYLPQVDVLNARGRRRYQRSVERFLEVAEWLRRAVEERGLEEDVQLLAFEGLWRFEHQNYNFVMDLTTMPPYVWRTEADKAVGVLLKTVQCKGGVD